jgi:AraC-like DNA-binding protein
MRKAVHSFFRHGYPATLLTVNEGMWQVFEPELRRRLSQLDETASTAERVRAVLLELLPGNEATIEKTAERLGMSKRTLQRRLEEEGENFRVLINRCRENWPDTI